MAGGSRYEIEKGDSDQVRGVAGSVFGVEAGHRSDQGNGQDPPSSDEAPHGHQSGPSVGGRPLGGLFQVDERDDDVGGVDQPSVLRVLLNSLVFDEPSGDVRSCPGLLPER